MKKIVIPTKLEKLSAEILERAGYAVVQDAETALAELTNAHPDCAALIVRSEKITPEIIDSLPELKLIVRAGAGFDTIDIAYARKKGIDVMNTPGANANAVAEEVVAMTLAHFRHIVSGDNTTRVGQWEKKDLMGRELTNKVFGIIGLGNIGRLVAKRIQGFEPTILGYDPILAPQKAREIGIEPCSLHEIFSKADVITIHVPGGADTKNMIDRELLSLMKDGATIINCARYGVVNENTLRELKSEGKTIYYLTDVYPEDKAGEKEVADIASIMLPHLGASTIEANLTAARRAAEQAIAYFEHNSTAFVVNKGTPDGLNPSYQRLAWMLSTVARKWTNGIPVRQIDCTFYGELHAFGKWFWAPILSGLSPNVDRGIMPSDAAKLLQNQGITMIEREPLEQKLYGNSMTIDLITEDQGSIQSLSLRGTLTEGTPMIARLGAFESLYFDMQGHSIFMHYQDRPGVIAKITSILAEKAINIENIIAPRNAQIGESLAVLRVDQFVSEVIIDEIRHAIGALHGFYVHF